MWRNRWSSFKWRILPYITAIIPSSSLSCHAMPLVSISISIILLPPPCLTLLLWLPQLCTALRCTVLIYSALRCSALLHAALRCVALRCLPFLLFQLVFDLSGARLCNIFNFHVLPLPPPCLVFSLPTSLPLIIPSFLPSSHPHFLLSSLHISLPPSF